MSVSKALRRHKGWIAAGLLVVIAATAYFIYRSTQQTEAAVTYQTDTATVSTISVTVSGTGNVEVAETSDVYPDTAGTVASVEVAKGSAVATGTVLLELDPADAEAATARAYSSYLQAQQTVLQAESQLAKAKADLADVKDRANDTTPTADSGDVEQAKLAVEIAEAGLASARSQRSSASADYEEAKAVEDDLTVTSPCSGIVWDVAVEAGDSVSTSSGSSGDGSSGASGAAGADGSSDGSSGSSSAPVTIAPEQPYAILLTVNEVDLPSLEVGQRADIEFDALPDLAATGKVSEVADEGTVSSGVVTFDVWLSLDVPDPSIKLGMSAGATIVTEIAKDALVVPNSAVRSADDGSSYVLVMADGATEPQQVTVTAGLSSSTQTQILSGIEAGTVVVVQTVDSSDTSTQQMGPGGGMGIGTFEMGGAPPGQ